MYVFKYSAPSILSFGALSRGELYFASAEELNDGSECRPRYILKGSAELWYRLADMILLDAMCMRPIADASPANLRYFAEPLGLALQAKVGKRDLDFEQLGPLVRSELVELIEGVDIGVAPADFFSAVERACAQATQYLHEPAYMASLSRTGRDPTMWGHYAGADRGFAIVFHAPEGKLRIESPMSVFFGVRPVSGTSIKVLGHYADAEVELEPVLYRAAPQRFNAFYRLIPHFNYSEYEDHFDVRSLLPGDAPAKQEKQFGLVKAATWKYEQEVRAMLPSFQELTPEARCMNYDWTQVAGLIFGPKMSQADKTRAVVCCEKLRVARAQKEPRSEPFVFLQARQQVSSFEMAVTAAGVLDGSYADGTIPFRPICSVDDAAKAKAQKLASVVDPK